MKVRPTVAVRNCGSYVGTVHPRELYPKLGWVAAAGRQNAENRRIHVSWIWPLIGIFRIVPRYYQRNTVSPMPTQLFAAASAASCRLVSCSHARYVNQIKPFLNVENCQRA